MSILDAKGFEGVNALKVANVAATNKLAATGNTLAAQKAVINNLFGDMAVTLSRGGRE